MLAPLGLTVPFKVAVVVVIAEALLVATVGGAGTAAGVTLFEAADAGPVPIALVALTVKV